MVYKFTNSSKRVIEISNKIAMEFGHKYVGTEHILYGLTKEGTGIANKVLENQNIVEKLVKEQIESLTGKSEKVNTTLGLTPRTKRVLENAYREAKKLGAEYIGTEHLLIGIMREGDSVAAQIMLELKVDPRKLYSEIVKVINEYEIGEEESQTNMNRVKNSSYSVTPTLNQFGNDLTKDAEKRKA